MQAEHTIILGKKEYTYKEIRKLSQKKYMEMYSYLKKYYGTTHSFRLSEVYCCQPWIEPLEVIKGVKDFRNPKTFLERCGAYSELFAFQIEPRWRERLFK